MRKAFIISVLFILFSCESDDNRVNNPFLVDIAFQSELNMNLPQYSVLGFENNHVVVTSAGIKGFVIHNYGSQFRAFELSDPNHSPNSCSRMSVSGIEVSCPCTDDINVYSLLTGQPLDGDGQYGMKEYRVERNGNIIRVYN